MLREGSLEEISDGKLYKENDLVKTDCQGCQGCSRCCEEMADTIYLNPLDAFHISIATGKSVSDLLENELELVVRDGVILPNLRAAQKKDKHSNTAINNTTNRLIEKEKEVAEQGENNTCCPFLQDTGRCSIHQYRPDICRLFPLGRYYEGDDYFYFLQVHECDHSKIKTKVKKWIDIPEYQDYKEFILLWHQLVQELSRKSFELGDHGKAFQIGALKYFYLIPFGSEETFYQEFKDRLARYREIYLQ